MCSGIEEAMSKDVTPRERRVSRNCNEPSAFSVLRVTPRERRVSRNEIKWYNTECLIVTPRERRVSRNCR